MNPIAIAGHEPPVMVLTFQFPAYDRHGFRNTGLLPSTALQWQKISMYCQLQQTDKNLSRN
jgi:hypothetical protein